MSTQSVTLGHGRYIGRIPFGFYFTVDALLAMYAAYGWAHFGRTSGILSLAFAAVAFARDIRITWKWRHGNEPAARAAAEKTFHCRKDGLYINRDERVFLIVQRHGPRGLFGRVVLRADEDQWLEVHEQGRAPVTFEVFVFTRPFLGPRVGRRLAGGMANDESGFENIRRGYIRTRRIGTSRRAGGGLEYADAADLTELARQFRAAEPMVQP